MQEDSSAKAPAANASDRTADARRATLPSASVPAASPGRETILLAEDDPAVRRFVRVVLESRGYVVLDAPDGEQALAVSERHGGSIDLLLTDVEMPTMGGPALARELTVRRPGTPILFMSGAGPRALVGPGSAVAAPWCLAKPFTPARLLTNVREAIGSRGRRLHG